MSRTDHYEAIYSEIKAVLEGERDPVIWMSTVSCVIKQHLGFYWVGFYRMVGNELLVGPYQGTLGCIRIPLAKGVCGACASRRETILVPDVHEFPGHIACDPRSNSEIVLPVFDAKGGLRAVLDVDSEQYSDFGDPDRQGLERIVAEMRELDWTNELSPRP